MFCVSALIDMSSFIIGGGCVVVVEGVVRRMVGILLIVLERLISVLAYRGRVYNDPEAPNVLVLVL